MMRQAIQTHLIFLLLAYSCGQLAAQGFYGGEIQVNSDPSGLGLTADLDSAPDGTFVIVWDQLTLDQPNPDSWSILGQRYSPMGSPLGEIFVVSAQSTDSQVRPQVAMGPSGAFVVTWPRNSMVNIEASTGPEGRSGPSISEVLGSKIRFFWGGSRFRHSD